MSGKFMKTKKVIIPTITMVIIASQLMGCAAATQSELLQMINNGDAIEIEVATPISEEQGEESSLTWEQLALLTTNPELRKSMDDIFKIVQQGGTKNGVFYVDLEGNQNGNNTLYNTFANNKFRNYWEDGSVLSKVAEASLNTYTDVEYDGNEYSKAVYAAMNGYFNLLSDSVPGYANMDSTITRLEAMAALFKAENPVTDFLAEDKEFNMAVDPSNSNGDTIYASNLSEQSYLDIGSGSLDSMTANGTITRGELVYLLVQQYFKADYDNADTNAEAYPDAINGGDIATKQKFIEEGNQKKYWQSYELTYALQNPDEGCPERMYKALVVAFDKGIITDTNSRWDEGATKADFMEMLTNTYEALPTVTDSERGLTEELEAVEEEANTETRPINEDTTAEETTEEFSNDARLAEMLEEMKEEYESGKISEEQYLENVAMLHEIHDMIDESQKALSSTQGQVDHIEAELPLGATVGDPSKDVDINFDGPRNPDLAGDFMN